MSLPLGGWQDPVWLSAMEQADCLVREYVALLEQSRVALLAEYDQLQVQGPRRRALSRGGRYVLGRIVAAVLFALMLLLCQDCLVRAVTSTQYLDGWRSGLAPLEGTKVAFIGTP